MMILILMLAVPLAYSKPHVAPNPNLQRDIVQIEKQELRHITPEEQNTQNILNKIQEVNRNQGLIKKSIEMKSLPNVQRIDVAKQQHFQFPQFGQFMQNPFSNPILDYMHGVQNSPIEQQQLKNAEVNSDDQVPGQYIKRKITHQQSMIIPGPSVMSLYNNEVPEYPTLGFAKQAPPSVSEEDTDQSVENIRNVVNNQLPFPYMNPYGYPIGYRPAEIGNPQFQRQGFWQSPLSQYFPIMIKDPLQQIINAVTSMVEYGPPPGNSQAACADISKCVDKYDPNCRSHKTKQLEIEDLQLTGNKEEPLKFTVKLNNRDESQRLVKDSKGRINNKLPSLANILGIKTVNKSKDHTKLGGLFSLPDKEKPQEQSHDNMGDGIFLHKLRVKEGGVAIAGPGGIATAGNGGTAIVGPDGYAYTQPDSLAIAGSGTKVIAVNPGIDLSQLVKNISRTNNDELSSRIGRVVAVGPVVYYNKG